jgi:hypothetical protein
MGPLCVLPVEFKSEPYFLKTVVFQGNRFRPDFVVDAIPRGDLTKPLLG